MADYPELVFSDDKEFNASLLNKAFETLNLRLNSVEGLSISYESAVEVIRNYGLQRLNEALQPVYDELVSISQIGVIFSAPTSTVQPLSTGSKTFFINENRRLNFAPAAYLQIQSTEDTSKALYGSTQSYDPKTGSLIVLVDQIRGIDTSPINSWVVSAAGTPDFISTAHEIGAYTQSETDGAINSAISDLKGSAPNSLNTLGKVAAYLLSLTDAASLVSNFAQTSTALINRLQVDGPQNLSPGQVSQALANLNVGNIIKPFLASQTSASARTAISAQADLGFYPVQQGGGAQQQNNKIFLGWNGGSLSVQVDDNNRGKIWTDGDSVLSPGGIGYTKLPNGLIIQWGSGAAGGSVDYFVPYPVTFTSGTLYASASPIGNPDPSVVYTCIMDTPNPNGVGVRRRIVGPNGVTTASFPYFWVAIGI